MSFSRSILLVFELTRKDACRLAFVEAALTDRQTKHAKLVAEHSGLATRLADADARLELETSKAQLLSVEEGIRMAKAQFLELTRQIGE